MNFSNRSSGNNKASARRTLAVTLLAGTSFLCAKQVLAQPGDASSQPAASSQVQEVVVTARRRTESLEKVPIAVSVVTSAIMKQQNRNNVTDLIAILPSVELRAQPENKDTDILIRGLGTITTSAGAEPTVSTVLDGVVLARPGQMVSNLLDVNNIQVLRGPQGTLFGKNASAGVIEITTNDPTATPGGSINLAYYQGNEFRVETVANGPLIKDVLSGRIAAVYATYPGNSENLFYHDNTNGYKTEGLRAKLLYAPTDRLSVLLSGDYIWSSGTGQSYVFLSNYNIGYPSGIKRYNPNLLTALTAEGITPSFTNTQVSLDTAPFTTDMSTGVAGTIHYSFNGFNLTSITSYREWRNKQAQDIDGYATLTSLTPFNLADLGHVRESQFTQEVRLNSPVGHFLDYVVGAYFFYAPDREDYKRTTTQLHSGGNIVNYGLNYYGAVPTNYSVFGEADINFTKSLRAIAGLRLVHDDLSFYTNRYSTSPVPVPGVNPSFAASGSTHVTDYADRLGLQYDVSSSMHTYFTYSRGYKGPAYNVFFNMNALQTNALLPETSNDFELGFKSNLFDRRAQLNVALFDDHVSNYQANEPDLVAGTVVTRLINAGSVSTKGVEIDAIARPIQYLTLSASYAYVDATIDHFNCPPGASASCNVNGKPLPFAPKNKLSARADYVVPLSNRLDASVDVEYTYQSSQQDSIQQTPDTIQPGYGIWNAGVSLTDKDAGWSLRFVVRNIANQHYYAAVAEANGGIIGQMPRDFNRYVGVILHKDF